MKSVTIGAVTIRVFEEHQYVESILPSGKVVGATREPSEQNIAQARELGYGDDVWLCLIEHEIAHHVLAEKLSEDGISLTMRFEAGEAPHIPYFLRLWEEAIVLAFQRWMRTGKFAKPLAPFTTEQIGKWRNRVQRVVQSVHD
jgi:hypothetical protein